MQNLWNSQAHLHNVLPFNADFNCELLRQYTDKIINIQMKVKKWRLGLVSFYCLYSPKYKTSTAPSMEWGLSKPGAQLVIRRGASSSRVWELSEPSTVLLKAGDGFHMLDVWCKPCQTCNLPEPNIYPAWTRYIICFQLSAGTRQFLHLEGLQLTMKQKRFVSLRELTVSTLYISMTCDSSRYCIDFLK